MTKPLQAVSAAPVQETEPVGLGPDDPPVPGSRPLGPKSTSSTSGAAPGPRRGVALGSTETQAFDQWWVALRDQARSFAAGRGMPVWALLAAGVVAVVAVGGVAAIWVRSRSSPRPVELSLPMASVVSTGDAAIAEVPASDSGAPAAVGDDESDDPRVESELVVHAAGAVLQPGLYRLPPATRVADLVDAAGGLAPDADRDRINLAEPLVDGVRVYVLRRGEQAEPAAAGVSGGAAAGGGAGPGGSAAKALVNVNTASVDQLDTLPGVGPATARAIVDHRERHGRFRSLDDLLEVRGIGPAKLDALRVEITL